MAWHDSRSLCRTTEVFDPITTPFSTPSTGLAATTASRSRSWIHSNANGNRDSDSGCNIDGCSDANGNLDSGGA